MYRQCDVSVYKNNYFNIRLIWWHIDWYGGMHVHLNTDKIVCSELTSVPLVQQYSVWKSIIIIARIMHCKGSEGIPLLPYFQTTMQSPVLEEYLRCVHTKRLLRCKSAFAVTQSTGTFKYVWTRWFNVLWVTPSCMPSQLPPYPDKTWARTN